MSLSNDSLDAQLVSRGWNVKELNFKTKDEKNELLLSARLGALGWDKKYSFEHQRCYYIDHKTRNTTWTLPVHVQQQLEGKSRQMSTVEQTKPRKQAMAWEVQWNDDKQIGSIPTKKGHTEKNVLSANSIDALLVSFGWNMNVLNFKTNEEKDELLTTSFLNALGWDRKYSVEEKRWYYIDHKTRTTTWTLPAHVQQNLDAQYVSNAFQNPKAPTQSVAWDVQLNDGQQSRRPAARSPLPSTRSTSVARTQTRLESRTSAQNGTATVPSLREKGKAKAEITLRSYKQHVSSPSKFKKALTPQAQTEAWKEWTKQSTEGDAEDGSRSSEGNKKPPNDALVSQSEKLISATRPIHARHQSSRTSSQKSSIMNDIREPVRASLQAAAGANTTMPPQGSIVNFNSSNVVPSESTRTFRQIRMDARRAMANSENDMAHFKTTDSLLDNVKTRLGVDSSGLTQSYPVEWKCDPLGKGDSVPYPKPISESQEMHVRAQKNVENEFQVTINSLAGIFDFVESDMLDASIPGTLSIPSVSGERTLSKVTSLASPIPNPQPSPNISTSAPTNVYRSVLRSGAKGARPEYLLSASQRVVAVGSAGSYGSWEGYTQRNVISDDLRGGVSKREEEGRGEEERERGDKEKGLWRSYDRMQRFKLRTSGGAEVDSEGESDGESSSTKRGAMSEPRSRAGSTSRRMSISSLLTAVRRWTSPNVSTVAKKLRECLKQLEKRGPGSPGPGGTCKPGRRLCANAEKEIIRTMHDELIAHPDVSLDYNYKMELLDIHIFIQCWKKILELVDGAGTARQELYYQTILLLIHRPELRCEALVNGTLREEVELRRMHELQIMATFKFVVRKMSRKRACFSAALTSFATAVMGYVYFCMPNISALVVTRMSAHVESLQQHTPAADPTSDWDWVKLSESVRDYAKALNYETNDSWHSQLSESIRRGVDSSSPYSSPRSKSPAGAHSRNMSNRSPSTSISTTLPTEAYCATSTSTSTSMCIQKPDVNVCASKAPSTRRPRASTLPLIHLDDPLCTDPKECANDVTDVIKTLESDFSETSVSSRDSVSDHYSSHRQTSSLRGSKLELSWLFGKSVSTSGQRTTPVSANTSRRGSKAKVKLEGPKSMSALFGSDSPLLASEKELSGQWVDRLLDDQCALFFLVVKEVFLYVNVKRRRADFIPQLLKPTSLAEDFFAIPKFAQLIAIAAFLLARKSSLLPDQIETIVESMPPRTAGEKSDDCEEEDSDLWSIEALFMLGEFTRCVDAVDLIFHVVFIRTNLRNVEHTVANLIFLGDWVQTLRDNSDVSLKQLNTDALCDILEHLLEEEHYLILQYTVLFLCDVLPAFEGHLHARVSTFVLEKYWEKMMYHWSVHVRGLFQHFLVYACIPCENLGELKEVLYWTDGFMCKPESHVRLPTLNYTAPTCVGQYRILTKLFAARMLALRHHHTDHECFASYDDAVLQRAISSQALVNNHSVISRTYSMIAEKELIYSIERAMDWINSQNADLDGQVRIPAPKRTDTSISAA
eukprot:CFRG2211T1